LKVFGEIIKNTIGSRSLKQIALIFSCSHSCGHGDTGCGTWFEIGLCHDLLEDTGATPDIWCAALDSCGYNEPDCEHITDCVLELTEEFTKAHYPGISKKLRKKKKQSGC
jgi:hypothetical protein